jgi:dipeptidyl aminopeptidase/acylaminoacyl peptidase
MKSLAAVLSLAFAAPVFAASGPHPFDVHDLVMMDRVSDPSLSPDGKVVAFSLRETDYDANKGVNSVWIVPAGGGKTVRLTDKALNATNPRWSPDGSVWFTAPKDGTAQLWRVGASGGAATQATTLAMDVNNFKFSPDGKRILISLDVFNECADDSDGILACTKKKLDERKATKATGMVYDKVFIRHWDTWSDGRRSQLFIADVADGKVGTPKLLTKGIDGDVPSKPFGDDGEYAFSPDGATVYFDARIAGKSEPWSTNFDIFSVPTDGSGSA